MTISRRFRALAIAGVALSALALSACTPPAQAPGSRTEVALPAQCPAGGGPAAAPPSVFVGPRGSSLIAPADYRPGVAYPLLVSLHPFLLDEVAWESYSLLAQAASARGYFVLVPRGSDPGPRWSVAGGLDYGTDDVAWVDELVRTTASTVCIDRDRVFAAGFSAGAAMSVSLSCELPWRFRAIAASGGSNLTSLCPGQPGVDALILHGTADPIAPLDGQTLDFLPPKGITVDSVVATFAGRNGCAGSTPVVRTPTVTAQVFSCTGHRLEFWPERGAGHTWAGAAFPLDLVTGPTDTTFSASTAVLDFFDAA